jgi:hypothetical protein
MQKYQMEFMLCTGGASDKEIKASLTEFSERLEIAPCAAGTDTDFRIKLIAEEPTLIFDQCAQFGKIKGVKVEEAECIQ